MEMGTELGEDVVPEKVSPGELWAAATRTAASAMLRALAWTLAIYFGLCWIGGLSGMGPMWTARVAPTLAICGAFWLEAFGANALAAALPGRWRLAWKAARWAWHYGLLLEICGRVLVGALNYQPFRLEQAPHLVLSPYVSLALLFRHPLPDGPVLFWWSGALLQGGIGLVAWLSALWLHSRGLGASTSVPKSPGLEPLRRWLRGVGELIARPLYAFDEMLLRQAGAMDNPLMVAAFRRRLRQSQGVRLLRVLGGLEVCGGVAGLGFLWGSSTGMVEQSYTLMGAFLAGAWLLLGLVALGLGVAFDKERANGALVFLFLTPLTEAGILAGKLVPALVEGALLLLATLPVALAGDCSGSWAWRCGAAAAGLLRRARRRHLVCVRVLRGAVACRRQARKENGASANSSSKNDTGQQTARPLRRVRSRDALLWAGPGQPWLALPAPSGSHLPARPVGALLLARRRARPGMPAAGRCGADGEGRDELGKRRGQGIVAAQVTTHTVLSVRLDLEKHDTFPIRLNVVSGRSAPGC